jgi:3-deoxy-manno-octulosonate cytidylyltransferase (CMP-KDO synthetase)
VKTTIPAPTAWEVAAKLGLAPDAIVVNVQGDEPLIPPSVIDQVAANLAAHTEARMATLAEPIEDVETLFNPNVVKVVSDINGLALTFSRATLPWARDAFAKSRDVLPEGVPYRRHIGIYAYRAGFLQDFVSWGPCWLENTEALEQLRALWHGVRIHVADALIAPPAGSTPLKTLSAFVACWRPDARSVRVPGQHLPFAHRRRRVAPQIARSGAGGSGRSGLRRHR